MISRPKLAETTVMCWVAAGVVTSIVVCATLCLAQPQQPPSASQGASLKEFLRKYLSNPKFGELKETRYSVAFVDLKDDGKQEAIVYLTGNGWCGSGGCTTLILMPKDSSYDVISKITITRLPIRVLTTKSKDWHDIAVRVQGGGIQHSYDAKLAFDGRSYPKNPTVAPAVRLTNKEKGEVAIPLGITGELLVQ